MLYGSEGAGTELGAEAVLRMARLPGAPYVRTSALLCVRYGVPCPCSPRLSWRAAARKTGVPYSGDSERDERISLSHCRQGESGRVRARRRCLPADGRRRRSVEVVRRDARRATRDGGRGRESRRSSTTVGWHSTAPRGASMRQRARRPCLGRGQ